MERVLLQPLARYAALSGYREFSESLGLDWVRLMRGEGLDPAGLATQDKWIPAAAAARLLEISARASGRDDFGLRMAGLRRLANLGPLAVVIREESDARSALELLIRYEHACNEAMSIRTSQAGGLATIRLDLEFGEPVGARQSTELAIGALHGLLRDLLGTRWQAISVRFPHPAPADIRTHTRTFGPVMRFGSGFAGIVLHVTDLAAPNKMSDPLLQPYVQPLLDSMGPPSGVSLVARVRDLIQILLPTGHCSATQVARSLGIDRRTLHRYLAESGETFTSLVNAIRIELAARSVASSYRPLTEIACQLGFSGSSAFSRWFRGQFGCTPNEWRNQAQASS